MDRRNETVVVIEDDDHISDLVALYLRRAGFDVCQVREGEAGVTAAGQPEVCMVIVDVGLPGQIDGFEACRRIRTSGRVPVVMLTARDDEIDKVVGLELGADDYVTKPFSARELVARVRAILRRSDPRSAAPSPAIGSVTVDVDRHEVSVGNEVVDLTAREFSLLSFLANHRGQALTRRQLLDGAWDPAWVGDERTVDVHVLQLRRKLGPSITVSTVRGVGYRLD